MKKTTLLLVLLIALFSEIAAQQKVDWNGYGQVRVSSNFDDNTSVMLRRLKFWVKSTPEFSPHWSYKVQVLFTSWMQERFFLQEAHLNYKTGLFSFDIGQFVPKYSLQWSQPDYHIPAIERSIVINTLFPNAGLGIRDLGAQMNFHTQNHFLETSLGLFNGYGITEYRFNNQGYMITHQTALNIPISKEKLKVGYSLEFREAEQMKMKHLLPDTVLFTGQDSRFNLFAMFQASQWQVQGEYLMADLNGARAKGYYVLGSLNVKKSQMVLGIEQYEDLIDETNDSPHYRIGYNYRFKEDKIKLFFDNYFQVIDGGIKNYYASVQLQMFFK